MARTNRQVIEVLRTLRKRYQQLTLTERPADLDDLLQLAERLTLTYARAWPLTWKQVAYVTEPPADRRRRLRRRLRGLERIVVNVLADQLPEAVAMLTAEVGG